MTTRQSYVGKANYVLTLPETAQNQVVTSSQSDKRQPCSVEEFIIQNADLFGSYPGCLAAGLTERLQSQPVQYTSVLDAIALLRAFAPLNYSDTTYAVLLKGWTIVGLAWLPALTDSNDSPVFNNDRRQAIKCALEIDANKILLASSIGEEGREFTPDELREINFYQDGFDFFGIEFLDWLLLTPCQNDSYVLGYWGANLLGEITPYEFYFHYTDFVRLPGISPAY